MVFNVTGRGIPEVAVNATNDVTDINGALETVFGTSASSQSLTHSSSLYPGSL
jgi:hypothetical protein